MERQNAHDDPTVPEEEFELSEEDVVQVSGAYASAFDSCGLT